MDTLHIYSQDAWHDTAYIVGDRQSLTAFRDCLTEALDSGGATKFNSFTNDGEGYSIEILPLDDPQMETMRLPYHGDIALDTDPGRSWPHVLVASSEKPEFLEVSAEVRYWEDSHVNGDRDIGGTMIPHRSGKLWTPLIRLKDGQIMDWPQGTTAKIFYKVCDEGEYWLRSVSRRLFKYKDYYVPDSYLCHGDQGFGDCIILNIGPDGMIIDWQEPRFASEYWEPVLP